jgi:DNA-binding HxlR family transcriptional regulator
MKMEITIKQEALPVMCAKMEHACKVIGKKWNSLIIEVLLATPLRFGQLRDSINGISDRVLIERLRELSEEGIVCKEETEVNGHMVTIYNLTDKGHDLQKIFNSLHVWADEWVEPAE